MKNCKGLTKSERLMMLSTLVAFGNKFEDVKQAAQYAILCETRMASKVEIRSAQKKVSIFFKSISGIEIKQTDSTIVGYCKKVIQKMLKETTGAMHINNYCKIRDAVDEIRTNEVEEDDSYILVAKLK